MPKIYKQVSRAILLDEQNRVLLGKRVRNGAVGEWALIGGKPEGNETAEQTIVREVREELGLVFKPVFFKTVIDQIPGEKMPWQVSFFSGRVSGTIKADQNEVGEVRFFSERELDAAEVALNHRQVLQDFFKSGSVARGLQ